MEVSPTQSNDFLYIVSKFGHSISEMIFMYYPRLSQKVLPYMYTVNGWWYHITIVFVLYPSSIGDSFAQSIREDYCDDRKVQMLPKMNRIS